jgi:cyclophilin family peptidyl-prolyl cis-trans isomerase
MTPTPPLAGSHTPDTLELLWERNRRLFQVAFWLLLVGLLGYYGVRYYEQWQLNAKWSDFAASALLTETYSPAKAEMDLASPAAAVSTLLQELRETPATALEAALARADESQAPFLLWLLVNKAVIESDGDAANRHAETLRARFPNHPLCVESAYPIQVREPKDDPAADKPKSKDKGKAKPQQPVEPELLPATPGSSLGMLLQQLQAAKAFVPPSHFAKPEIPADAPRYRVSLEGEYGEIVIALLPQKAPLHCAKFESLAASDFWNGIKVDEVARPGTSRWSEQVREFHFGFESTRTEANRADWDTTSASVADNLVEEVSPLSHFEGAVAARSRDGKSEVDRLYVCGSDAPARDEHRQVFGYVVEGIEAVRRICDVSLARSEDEVRGRGAPSENIVIKSVTKL